MSRAPRAWLVGGGLGVLAASALGFLPLFGGPGYEIALGCGAFLPALVAVSASIASLDDRRAPLAVVASGSTRAFVVAVLAWATTLVHGARVGFCGALEGSLTFALGPAAGTVWAGTLGACIGVALSARRGRASRRALVSAAFAAAIALPLGSAALGVALFVATPMVFAFDPFVGFFSGTLYDTVVDAVPGLALYRVGTALSLVATFALAAHLRRRDDGTLALAWPGTPGVTLVAIAATAASFAHSALGERLGHRSTSASIAAELGGLTSGARCDVVHPTTLRDEEARLFARDCDEALGEVERWLGVAPTGRVRAFVFRDSAEKRRLMGAADTLVAKPWRREIYVQGTSYPHPVLGHELAHVVAGSIARGPFRVAGALGGWLPNPGLIEGLAVAASPDDEDLTPTLWARSMRDLGLLPPLSRVFALAFLSDNASRSYTTAGAFVAWVRETFGAEAVRAWYAGATPEAATGRPLAELERAFVASLDAAPVSPRSDAVARARFDRAGLFARRCPHEIDAARRAADRALGRGDLASAERALATVLALDPREPNARYSLALCRGREGDAAGAEARLRDVAADANSPRPLRDRALLELADRALVEGRLGDADATYREVASRAGDEDVLRTIDVKLRAVADPSAREAIVALLLGTPSRGVDASLAGARLGAWATSQDADGLPQYLLGRGLVQRGWFAEASASLETALARPFREPRVEREAVRLAAVAACARADRVTAARLSSRYAELGAPPGRVLALSRLAARCAASAP